MNSGAKRVLAPLSPPPSAFTESAVFTDLGGDAELRCVYERNGARYVGGFSFQRVQAYRFRQEAYCTAWHVEDAYDTLVEVDGSSWIGELREAFHHEYPAPLRHFLIYVDSAGAYEVAAADAVQLVERPAE